jgi:hypothetical protein
LDSGGSTGAKGELTAGVGQAGPAAPPAAREDYVPGGFDLGGDVDTREAFQATEVVRRLCGAMAGGAHYVGWHSYQSVRTASAAFYGLGLRHDAEEGNSTDTRRRWAWFVYQRLEQCLVGVSGAALVLPKDQPVDRDETGSRRNGLVFAVPGAREAGGGDRYANAYVVMYDGWNDGDAVTLRIDAPAGTTCAIVHLRPWQVENQAADEVAGGELPDGEASCEGDVGESHWEDWCIATCALDGRRFSCPIEDSVVGFGTGTRSWYAAIEGTFEDERSFTGTASHWYVLWEAEYRGEEVHRPWRVLLTQVRGTWRD